MRWVFAARVANRCRANDWRSPWRLSKRVSTVTRRPLLVGKSSDVLTVGAYGEGVKPQVPFLNSLTYGEVAPAVGFEPTTKRLTAARSTTELRRNGVDRDTRPQTAPWPS